MFGFRMAIPLYKHSNTQSTQAIVRNESVRECMILYTTIYIFDVIYNVSCSLPLLPRKSLTFRLHFCKDFDLVEIPLLPYILQV